MIKHKSNIINRYGRMQSLCPITKLRTTPCYIIELNIIKTSHYKLTKKWCRWYFDVDNKRYYLNGKLLKITRLKYAACGEYILEIKCRSKELFTFTNKLLKHTDYYGVY